MGRKSTENRNYSKSKGQTHLYEIVVDIFPDAQIKQDLNLGKFLRKKGYSWAEFGREYGASLAPLIADIVVFEPFIILEYNGEQHYRFTSHWHGDKNGFKKAQERDNQKIWLCQRLGIPLVIFKFDEDINRESVKKKIKESMATAEILPGFKECPQCERILSPKHFNNKNLCVNCQRDNKHSEEQLIKNREIMQKQKEEQKNNPKIQAQKEIQKEKQKELRQKQKEENKEYNESMKEKQRELRKKKQEEYKQSDYYQKQKERQKQLRQEAYERQKEWRKKHKS